MPLRKISEEDNFIIKKSNISGGRANSLLPMAAVISAETREVLAKKLFFDDPTGFELLLEQIGNATDWVVAHRLIQDYFTVHAINPYQDEATQFSNMIYKRYYPKDDNL